MWKTNILLKSGYIYGYKCRDFKFELLNIYFKSNVHLLLLIISYICPWMKDTFEEENDTVLQMS